MTEAQASFEELYLAAPFGYLSTTPAGTITLVNDTLLEWLGATREDFIGSEFAALLDTGSRMFYETRHQPVLHLQGAIREVALVLRRPDGSLFHVLANSTLVLDAEQRPVEVRTALLDAEERQEYERSLLKAQRSAEASESRLRVLQSATARFIAATTHFDVAEALASSATDASDATTVTVLLVQDGELRSVAGTPRVPVLGGAIQRAFETKQTVTIESVQDGEYQFPEYVETMRVNRFVAVSATPLLHGETAIGVLLCTYGRERHFTPAARELQTALAQQASIALVRLRLQAELEWLAQHDTLTGLASRQLLHEHAAQVITAAQLSNKPLAFMFFDLDGFKGINDRLGHTTGDEALREIASRLRAAVRDTDFCARFGGDEFVVVCADADATAAAAIAERIRLAVSTPLDGIDLSVTASIGVAVIRPGSDAIHTEELLARADAAMYRSKDAGRDRVTVDVVR